MIPLSFLHMKEPQDIEYLKYVIRWIKDENADNTKGSNKKRT